MLVDEFRVNIHLFQSICDSMSLSMKCDTRVAKRRKKDNGGGKEAFAWILGVLHYSILKCHKNCHNFENSLKRAYWIEQIKSVLVETPATSTIHSFSLGFIFIPFDEWYQYIERTHLSILLHWVSLEFTPLWGTGDTYSDTSLNLKIKFISNWLNGLPPRWRHCNAWIQKLFYDPRWTWWWSDRFQRVVGC